jgi:hypothetical protein
VPFYCCSVLIHLSPVDVTDSASKQNTFLCLSETRNFNTVWDLRPLRHWILELRVTGIWRHVVWKIGTNVQGYNVYVPIDLDVRSPLFRRFSKNCEKRLLASSRLSFCPPVCAHGTNRLSLYGVLLNLIFDYFSIIFRESSSFIKIWQE